MKKGDMFKVWWSTPNSNFAKVLEVSDYAGRYKSMFTHVLKLEAPNTKRGWLEQAVKLEDM
jgi:hypothetical protein